MGDNKNEVYTLAAIITAIVFFVVLILGFRWSYVWRDVEMAKLGYQQKSQTCYTNENWTK